MVQKSGQPADTVGYPIIYRILYVPGGWPWDFWTINSIKNEGQQFERPQPR